MKSEIILGNCIEVLKNIQIITMIQLLPIRHIGKLLMKNGIINGKLKKRLSEMV